jgi:hypothetical protein
MLGGVVVALQQKRSCIRRQRVQNGGRIAVAEAESDGLVRGLSGADRIAKQKKFSSPFERVWLRRGIGKGNGRVGFAWKLRPNALHQGAGLLRTTIHHAIFAGSPQI